MKVNDGELPQKSCAIVDTVEEQESHQWMDVHTTTTKGNLQHKI